MKAVAGYGLGSERWVWGLRPGVSYHAAGSLSLSGSLFVRNESRAVRVVGSAFIDDYQPNAFVIAEYHKPAAC